MSATETLSLHTRLQLANAAYEEGKKIARRECRPLDVKLSDFAREFGVTRAQLKHFRGNDAEPKSRAPRGPRPPEEKALRLLCKLEAMWPENLWLFATGGKLCVMRQTGENMQDDACLAFLQIPNCSREV
jgi:hypothetical protein